MNHLRLVTGPYRARGPRRWEDVVVIVAVGLVVAVFISLVRS